MFYLGQFNIVLLDVIDFYCIGYNDFLSLFEDLFYVSWCYFGVYQEWQFCCCVDFVNFCYCGVIVCMLVGGDYCVSFEEIDIVCQFLN